jgi:hypothetical protein
MITLLKYEPAREYRIENVLAVGPYRCDSGDLLPERSSPAEALR